MRCWPLLYLVSLVPRLLRRGAGACLCALAVALVPGAGAAAPPAATPPAEPPEARAVRAEVAPVVDGDVLGDPAWANAPALTEFWQTAPEAG
ncbi:MAG TPA: hypothetical protein VLL75_05450, partial [Vicinamibacteria bacterium]|nr:hypothetical protein [Vicinamibacteria bacterium]